MASYAERPWTKHYDEGVPPTLDYPPIALHDLLRNSARSVPDHTALITTVRLPLFGRRVAALSYAELDRASDALAAALVDKGLRKGDRVVLVLPNVAAFVIAYYGVLKAGGVVAASNPTYPPPKMAYQVNDCDAEFVISLTTFYRMLKQIQPETKVKHIIVTNVKEYFPPLARRLFTLAIEKKEGHRLNRIEEGDFWLQDVLKQYDGQRPAVDAAPGDLAIFQYTGGTTGVSKGAMSTHRALIANMIQLKAWMAPVIEDYTTEVTLGAIPMFHVYGMVAVLSRVISAGATIVLVPNARDIDDVVDVIDVHKPDSFAGVPALFNLINNHPRVATGEADLSSLVLATSGSAPLPAAVQKRFDAQISGRVAEAFGMSEAPTATHCNPLNGDIRIGSIGLPLPDIDCRIVSLDDGMTDVPVGDIGELVIASPNLMKGYHRMPTETANALQEQDGKTWLFTGDIARMDEDGYFYIVDRKKDMALIGGFNVYPTQVEKVLKDHPAVLEVGVAAIAHPERAGDEALKAWVVFKPGQSASREEMIEHCGQYLAPYEVPRRYSFVDELPKSAVGKTLRRELVRIEMEERRRKPE